MKNSSSTLIIAEAGVNHNGRLDLAMRLIDAAADAGADLVKFQTFVADRLVTETAPKAGYQIKVASQNTQLEMLRQLELSRTMHEQLIDHCQKRKIGFFSTGFDTQSVDLLLELGLKRFKVPSGEITNIPYLQHVAKHGYPVILSTGMANMGEIEIAINTLESSGTPRDLVTVLHCSTEYPTPMPNVNLRAMLAIKAAFNVSVGYSDHTLGIEVPIAAVALGAEIIEKHLTLDRNLDGPDQAASLCPEEFGQMVKAIRNIESAMGDGIKRPLGNEENNKIAARKSIVAAVPILKGDLFTESNLTIKRPGDGLAPGLWTSLLGCRASRDFQKDVLIDL